MFYADVASKPKSFSAYVLTEVYNCCQDTPANQNEPKAAHGVLCLQIFSYFVLEKLHIYDFKSTMERLFMNCASQRSIKKMH